MTKKLSKKQMRAIHAKNYVGIVVIRKGKTRNADTFVNDKPMTSTQAFHSAAVKSSVELMKPKYKIGSKRFALAIKKKDLNDFVEKQKVPKKNPGPFLIAEKTRGGNERLIARLGPRGETPEVIIGERKFLENKTPF